MTHYRVEPTGRADEWAWQVARLSDGCVVGWFRSERVAQAYAGSQASGEGRRAAPEPQGAAA